MSNTAETLPRHGDLLSDDELREVTRVPKGSQNGTVKQIKVLHDAGIYFWIRNDGSIGTTWYHVHNAKPVSAQNNNTFKPDFSVVR